MLEIFESKYYGKKLGVEVREECKIEVKQSQCLGFFFYYNLQFKFLVFVVSLSFRGIYSNFLVYEFLRIKKKFDRFFRFFIILVKFKGMLQLKLLEVVKFFIDRNENV